jgi:hypothetical protein
VSAMFLYGFIRLLVEHETCIPGNIFGEASGEIKMQQLYTQAEFRFI